MEAQKLLDKYCRSRGQYAECKIGRVLVIVEHNGRDLKPVVKVTWPSLGEVDTITALDSSASMTEAAALALKVESIIRDWDADQWMER
jgi:hypothetical protein